MSEHEQVWVKVNAPVDRGISELIRALSGFSRLRTVESCEGNNEWAWVCFAYGEDRDEEPWRELSDFVFGEIGPALVREFGSRLNVSIHITEAGQFRAEMAVRRDAIPAVAKTLEGIKRQSLAA